MSERKSNYRVENVQKRMFGGEGSDIKWETAVKTISYRNPH